MSVYFSFILCEMGINKVYILPFSRKMEKTAVFPGDTLCFLFIIPSFFMGFFY